MIRFFEAVKVPTPRALYFLSDKNFNNKILKPRVPDNFFTEKGFEDNQTKRVSFSTSIEGCLRGLSCNLTDREFFVHIPVGDYTAYKPDTKDVPDSQVTNEIWICSPVKVMCIGKIHITGDTGEEGIPFSYGKNKAELYDWNYYWVQVKLNQISSIEAVIENLNDALNDFNYGIVIDGQVVIENKDTELDFEKYRTLSSKEFLKYKTGVCWDYTHFETLYFLDVLRMKLVQNDWLRFDNTFSMYYMEYYEDDYTDPSNHTWLAYRLNDKIYAFESSWKQYKGITEFASEEDMIHAYYDRNVRMYRKAGIRLSNPTLHKYLPMKPGLDWREFVRRIHEIGVRFPIR